ncbi:MAG: FecR family protein, partial [Pseudomonadales bacterium]|nr:FecR family protein [Pseudomonadales bacterium]
FDDYSFDGDDTTPDSAIMQLLRGGFRTMSGSIGRAKQDEHKVQTPYASIGIRGTTHLARIVDERLYTGVEDGATTITNDYGSLHTGLSGGYDFSETAPGEAPQGLMLEPPELNAKTFFVVTQEAPPLDDNRRATPNTVNAQVTSSQDTSDAGGGTRVRRFQAIVNTAPLSGAPPPGDFLDSAINPALNARTLEQLADLLPKR